MAHALVMRGLLGPTVRSIGVPSNAQETVLTAAVSIRLASVTWSGPALTAMLNGFRLIACAP